MRNFMSVAKAMADENRVRILMALLHGELCACQIQELLELAASTVSKHLAILYQARFVDFRKDGRWVYYRLSEADTDWAFVNDALVWMRKHLEDTPAIRADRERLNGILAVSREELCRQS